MIEQDLLEGNKYFKWYWSICNRAKDRILSPDIYIERHHIYPKSIYGQNKDLVKLTAKEHYMVHLLLWWGLRTKYGTKDLNTKKMAGAFSSMKMKKNGTHQRYYNSNQYELFKISYSESMHKVVYQNSIDGSIYNKEYKSVIIAAKNNDINKSGIANCCRGLNKTAENFIWSYHPLTKNELKKRLINIKNSITNDKVVYKNSLDGTIINKKYKSIICASKEININPNNIGSACYGRLKTAGGFIWSHDKLSSDEIKIRLNNIDDRKNNGKTIPILQYDLYDRFLKEYESITIASNINNIKNQNIGACCKGKIKSAGGFKWRYK